MGARRALCALLAAYIDAHAPSVAVTSALGCALKARDDAWEAYNNRRGFICFDGAAVVALSGGGTKRVCDLAPGDALAPASPGLVGDAVEAVWRSEPLLPGSSVQAVALAGGVRVTADHPVWNAVSQAWVLPGDHPEAAPAQPLSTLFNVLLQGRGPLRLFPATWAGSSSSSSSSGILVCTLGMPVPGLPDEHWGGEPVVATMREDPHWPALVTTY